MEKHKALGDRLQGEALKGTFDPPVKKLPIDPADLPGPGGTWWEQPPELWGEEVPEGEKRALDGNR